MQIYMMMMLMSHSRGVQAQVVTLIYIKAKGKDDPQLTTVYQVDDPVGFINLLFLPVRLSPLEWKGET